MEKLGFEIKTPWNELTAEQQDAARLKGTDPHPGRQPLQEKQTYLRPFEGILPILERQLRDASGESIRQKLRNIWSWCPALAAMVCA